MTSRRTGSLTGTVLDKDGAAIPNAKVILTEGSFTLETQSGGDGSFTFKNVPVGSYDLSYSAAGFATQQQSGTMQPGENDMIPSVRLVVATTVEVNVTQTREEIAEQQIKVQEQQRLQRLILGDRADLAYHGEMRQELLYSGCADFARMPAVMKRDITPQPLQIDPLRSERRSEPRTNNKVFQQAVRPA